MCQKETLYEGYGCVRIEFHSIFMISISKKRTELQKENLYKIKAEMEAKFYISVILFKEKKNPILKYTNLNTSI